MATWIWETPSWPPIVYDRQRLQEPLRMARMEQYRLLGKAEALGALEFSKVQREVWTEEAASTAAIEGENLPLDSIRSSVARRLGIQSDFMASVPRNVEGLLDVMESAAAQWQQPLTHDRLCRWQAALFPAGGNAFRSILVGSYRTHEEEMQIVSGPIGKQRVHYVAPPSSQVPDEMEKFLSWFNDESQGMDGIVRAGLAHIWFECIHPFEDGNGRVGRAIIDLALAQDAKAATRIHSISSQLNANRSEYYDALNSAQRSNDVTDWMQWFSGAFTRSCHRSNEVIDESIARSRFWNDHSEVRLNDRQRKVLNKLLDAGPGGFSGGLTAKKYVGMTGVSSVTAWRDIEELVKAGILKAGPAGGRSSSYSVTIPGWEWESKEARTKAQVEVDGGSKSAASACAENAGSYSASVGDDDEEEERGRGR